MAATVEQWREAIGVARTSIDQASQLVNAMEIGKGVPIGLDPNDARYQFDLTNAQKNANLQDLLTAVQAAIDALRAAKQL